MPEWPHITFATPEEPDGSKLTQEPEVQKVSPLKIDADILRSAVRETTRVYGDAAIVSDPYQSNGTIWADITRNGKILDKVYLGEFSMKKQEENDLKNLFRTDFDRGDKAKPEETKPVDQLKPAVNK